MLLIRKRRMRVPTLTALAAALMLIATELLAGGHDAAQVVVEASNGVMHVIGSVILPG